MRLHNQWPTCKRFQKNGKTPLHYAVESLQLEAARYILGRSSGGSGTLDGESPRNTRDREAEGIRLLDASHRTTLEVIMMQISRQAWFHACVVRNTAVISPLPRSSA